MTYAKYLFNLKKLKDDPSVDNGIFICPSLIDVPENDYKNIGDVYMTNKNELYGVYMFVRDDVKNKEESLITLNDLVDNLPEESNKEDIKMSFKERVFAECVYNSDDGTYTCKCEEIKCAIEHNNIPVNSCNITCVTISNSEYGRGDAWGNGYNYENHKVAKKLLTAGTIEKGYIYVNTSITKNDNDTYTLYTSIKQTPWSNTTVSGSNATLSGTQIHITVYFTVDKGDGDKKELNTQKTELFHATDPEASAYDVKYDGKLIFKYEFLNATEKIFTGTNIEKSYPNS